MFDLIAILIPIVLAVCIVVAIKIVEDSRLRRHMVDAGADETLVRAIMSTDNDSRKRGSLKWGVVLITIAAGFTAMWWFDLDAESPLSYALLFAATGIGLLAHRRMDPPSS